MTTFLIGLLSVICAGLLLVVGYLIGELKAPEVPVHSPPTPQKRPKPVAYTVTEKRKPIVHDEESEYLKERERKSGKRS